MEPDLSHLGQRFDIPGQFRDATVLTHGHINETYVASYDQAGARVRYVHQRINQAVFPNPPEVMENTERVLDHLHGKLADSPDPGRRALTLVPTRDGAAYHRDREGHYWRTYLFVERAQALNLVESAAQAREAARAFGRFQQQLVDLPRPRLHDTIPDFHHTPKRFAKLCTLIEKDPCNRAAGAARAIDFAMRHEPDTHRFVDLLAAGQLTERITHNDAKLNNVMMDEQTSEALCVIDLDTVMPGLSLYDFGDLVRTATTAADEDERDLSQVHMRPEMYRALVEGYLSTAAPFLTPTEVELLPFAGKLMTLEVGFRFLTDHLAGDTYFRVHRENHNLDRCRAQFRLVESIEAQEDAMARVASDGALSGG